MATSTYMRLNPQDELNTRRIRDKRFTHHSSSSYSNHHHPHIRVVRAAEQAQRQRKLREKRRPTTNPNAVSDSRTDGTTSDDAGEEVQYSSEEVPDTQQMNKLDQLFKKADLHLASDLEADCEDNNSTDVDTVSVSGSIKHKNCMEKSLESEDGFYLLPSSTVAKIPSVPERTLSSGVPDGAVQAASGNCSASPSMGSHQSLAEQQLLSVKIKNLEKQLETVLSLNVKLKEENEKLRKLAAASQADTKNQ